MRKVISGLAVTTEGLVSYWKMDETSGTTITDFASGNNATRHNSTINSVTGKIDGAHFYYFDESTEVGWTHKNLTTGITEAPLCKCIFVSSYKKLCLIRIKIFTEIEIRN